MANFRAWFDCDGRLLWIAALCARARLQPQILINNRLEIRTTEQWLHQAASRRRFLPPESNGAYDDKVPGNVHDARHQCHETDDKLIATK